MIFEKLLSLLSRGRYPAPPDTPRRNIAALVKPFEMPALHAVHTAGRTRSWFGGDPGLPPGMAPPVHGDKPLTFLARLSLAELHAAGAFDWLPRDGALLFFYDAEEQPWGYDPADRGKWAVLHIADSGDTPSGSQCIAFTPISTAPSWERPQVRDLALTDAEADDLFALHEAPFGSEPKHQVSGWPAPIQGDNMELDCQLACNGVYCGTPEGYQGTRAKALTAGAPSWRLLLQIDSDERVDYQWGDCGTLYFFVEEQRARAGDFTNVWLQLQCS